MSFSKANEVLIDLEPSSNAFDEYQKEFSSLISSSTASISAAKSVTDPAPDSAAGALNDADRDLGEAADLLKSMELEAESCSGNTRTSLRKHVAASRETLANMKNELRAARIALAQRKDNANRVELFQGSMGSDSLDQRARLSDTTQQLERGSEIIADSRRNIAETESIGASILEDLQSQRNTIIRARQSLGGVGTGLEESNSILSTMRRRAIVNRIIVYVVLAVIGFACLGVLYMRVFHRRRKD